LALVDVLNLDAGGSADLLRAHPDAFAQRFGEPGVVEYANAVGVQKTRHARCVARAGSVPVIRIRSKHDSTPCKFAV